MRYNVAPGQNVPVVVQSDSARQAGPMSDSEGGVCCKPELGGSERRLTL
jgi:hypothetical protein